MHKTTLLAPKMVRKQISVYKFLRIKNSHDSKRVVVFIANNFTIVKPVEAYLYKNHLYVLEGQIKPMAGSLAKRKTMQYRTTFFRYDITESTYIAERWIG